jgi:hypothetical protein
MTRRRTEEPDSEIVIPVTPMLDMTFQLLIFFIVTFNPNRLVEGFWDVTVSEVVPTNSQEKNDKTGDKNDQQKFPPEVIVNQLTIQFDDHIANSYFGGIAKAYYPNKDMGNSEDNPRPIDPREIDLLKDETDRKFAQDLAAKDKACYTLTLKVGDSRDATPEKVSYDELAKKLAESIQKKREAVEKAHEGKADKNVREAAIAEDMANYKIVISGTKTLRWWRFNQIRDLCYAAGYRNIQVAPPVEPEGGQK